MLDNPPKIPYSYTMKQLEFSFKYDPPTELPALELPHKLNIADRDDLDWYRVNKVMDKIFDTIPYGWRIYNVYCDVRLNIKSFYQRMRYGVADRECWDLDHTFSKFILPRLKHFKRMKRYGHPSDMTPEEWENIIDEMIWTFEYKLNPDKVLPFPPLEPHQTFSAYKESPAHIEYFSRAKVLDDRCEKGMQIFFKYYEHLWD